MLTTSAEGMELIKRFEGFSRTPYVCEGGKWTVGYGHTFDFDPVKQKDFIVSKAQAIEFLKSDLRRFENTVKNSVKVQLNQNQFNALVSLAYNIGTYAFATSTLVKELNHGNLKNASNQFLVWTNSKGEVLNGLIERRIKERELFLKDNNNAESAGEKTGQRVKEEKRMEPKKERCLQILSFAKDWVDTIYSKIFKKR